MPTKANLVAISRAMLAFITVAILSSEPSSTAAAFTLMIVAYAPALPETLGRLALTIALICVYASVVLCVLRGIPVLLEARRPV